MRAYSIVIFRSRRKLQVTRTVTSNSLTGMSESSILPTIRLSYFSYFFILSKIFSLELPCRIVCDMRNYRWVPLTKNLCRIRLSTFIDITQVRDSLRHPIKLQSREMRSRFYRQHTPPLEQNTFLKGNKNKEKDNFARK